MPNSNDAIDELQKQVADMVQEIGQEYTRTFSEEGSGKDSPRGKQTTTILSAA